MSPQTKPKVVAMIVASAIIMQQIDSTAITTALPQMAISLHTDPVRLSAAVTAYLLSLVLFRSVEKAQLIGTMAYLQVPAQLGPVLGPPMGGFITTYFSWRWIFLINVPLGILGIVLVTRFFDNPKEETRRPLDWIGFVLTGAALFCIMYGVEAIGRGRSEFTQMIVLLVLGVVLGTLALRHLLRSDHPMLDLSVFRIATFRASIGGGSLFRAGAGTLVFLLPLLLQIVFGLSAFASGSITFASAVGSMSMKATARPIIRRFGFRNVILVNGIISAATIGMCAFFTPAMPVFLIFALLLVSGFFRSLQFTATQAMIYADLHNPQMSTATSIAGMAQQLSRGFGVSFVAVLLQLSLARRGESTLGAADFTVAFTGAAALALMSLGFGWTLRHDAAAEVSGHRSKSAEV